MKDPETPDTIDDPAKTSGLTLAEQKEMVLIDGLTVTGAGVDGVFTTGREVRLSPFKIGKYEVTYELWHSVTTWASVTLGFEFANPGCEGENGGLGDEPTEEGKLEPVTGITWLDAVVWCNAYSRKEALPGECEVYYTDENYTSVLRSSKNVGTVYIKTNAIGYRLPTEAEWEAAARGGKPEDTRNWDYTYSGGNNISRVARYKINSSGKTSSVGVKEANSAGIYDMSGNVYEWCCDWFTDSFASGLAVNPHGPVAGTRHSYRGGGWDSADELCTVTYRLPRWDEDYLYNDLGFRTACTPEAQ